MGELVQFSKQGKNLESRVNVTGKLPVVLVTAIISGTGTYIATSDYKEALCASAVVTSFVAICFTQLEYARKEFQKNYGPLNK